MKALIGLGNPDIKYRFTRHNTGFLIMDEILASRNVALCDKFKGFFGKDKDFFYFLPKTYMNLSGNSVIELVNFYKLNTDDILVIYDDATIQFGTFRLKKAGSFGGHNGIKSIIERLGTDKFPRLKVGVGPIPSHQPIDSFVLSNFTSLELENIKKMGKTALELVEVWKNEGIEFAQNKFNGIVL